MKEVAAATAAVLGLSSAFALAMLPPLSYERAACQHIGGQTVITTPASGAPASSRCVLPGKRKD